MHDIKTIIKNSAAFDVGLQKRGLPALAQTLVDADAHVRTLQTKAQTLQAERNKLSKEIGIKKSRKESVDALMDTVAQTKQEEDVLVKEADGAQRALQEKLATIPNIPLPDVPVGVDEKGNKEVARYGAPPQWGFKAEEHWVLGERLGLMDFNKAAQMAGARFVILKGALAKLERAIAQFMLDTHTMQFGYTEVSVPLLVNKETAYGTGNLPKFEGDLFKTTDGRYLVPTAELPLTNMVAGESLKAEQLPMRFVACAPSFRSEAGSAGRDTRGMLRQHQFYKVEMVSIVTAEQAEEEHLRMTDCAKNILEQLEIPYKVMLLCTGDMGFSAQRTYDIEAWLPGQQTYREISSCSLCGDFQARRMQAKYKDTDGKAQYVHTLNGSGLAVGRTLIAVLENYQQADGSIRIPKVLIPYMQGLTVI